MTKIRIEGITDDHDCETCGRSYAQGFRVFFDDKLEFELEPIAHCFDGKHYDDEDVFREVLQRLGHELDEMTY